MRVMGTPCTTPRNKLTTELIAILAVGVAVLGQAAWLDGKIEHLHEGQAELRERLAAIETRFADPAGLGTSGNENLACIANNTTSGPTAILKPATSSRSSVACRIARVCI